MTPKPRLSISEQVSAYLHFYPGDDAKPLLDILNGELGEEAALQALAALSHGSPKSVWVTGQDRHASEVLSTAEILVSGGRLGMLKHLVASGTPKLLAKHLQPGELHSKAGWLERLCTVRRLDHMRQDGEPEFSKTSLFRLATMPMRDEADELLDLALDCHPAHPDIELLLKVLPGQQAAVLLSALMRHRIVPTSGSESALPITRSKRLV